MPDDVEEFLHPVLHELLVGEEQARHDVEVLLRVEDVPGRLEFLEDVVDEGVPRAVVQHLVGLDAVSQEFNHHRQAVLVELPLRRVAQAEEGRLFQEPRAVASHLRQVASRVVERSYPLPALLLERLVPLYHQQEPGEVPRVPCGGCLLDDFLDGVHVEVLFLLRLLRPDQFYLRPFLRVGEHLARDLLPPHQPVPVGVLEVDAEVGLVMQFAEVVVDCCHREGVLLSHHVVDIGFLEGHIRCFFCFRCFECRGLEAWERPGAEGR